MARANWTSAPVALLAVALIAGEAAGFSLTRFSEVWAWVAFGAALCACIACGWTVPCVWYVAAFMAGAALAMHAESRRVSLESYAKRLSCDGSPPRFELEVEGCVTSRCTRDAGVRNVSFRSRIGDIPVRVFAPAWRGCDIPSEGETWRCSGWLARRKMARSRYSEMRLWVTGRGTMQRTAPAQRRNAAAWYRRLAESLSRRAGAGLGWSHELASFGRAMLFGMRDGVSRKRLASFAAAGTIHVFAISGLHVMLMAVLLEAMLKGCGLASRWRSAIAMPVVACYVMLVGARPSAVRAALMVSMLLSARLFGRKPDSLAALGVSAVLVYGYDPAMVFDVGCALSFAVMAGIVLWIRWCAQFASPLDFMLRLAAREQALGDERRKDAILYWHGKASRILCALGISFAAWVAGTPVAAVAFERIALGGLVVNVAVVPMAGVAVALGALGAASSAVAPPLGALLNNVSAFCIYLMSRLSELVAGIPHSSFGTLRWSWQECAAWYVAWIALLMVLARHLPRRERIEVRIWG